MRKWRLTAGLSPRPASRFISGVRRKSTLPPATAAASQVTTPAQVAAPSSVSAPPASTLLLSLRKADRWVGSIPEGWGHFAAVVGVAVAIYGFFWNIAPAFERDNLKNQVEYYETRIAHLKDKVADTDGKARALAKRELDLEEQVSAKDEKVQALTKRESALRVDLARSSESLAALDADVIKASKRLRQLEIEAAVADAFTCFGHIGKIDTDTCLVEHFRHSAVLLPSLPPDERAIYAKVAKEILAQPALAAKRFKAALSDADEAISRAVKGSSEEIVARARRDAVLQRAQQQIWDQANQRATAVRGVLDLIDEACKSAVTLNNDRSREKRC